MRHTVGFMLIAEDPAMPKAFFSGAFFRIAENEPRKKSHDIGGLVNEL
jgi:hypothetical protein